MSDQSFRILQSCCGSAILTRVTGAFHLSGNKMVLCFTHQAASCSGLPIAADWMHPVGMGTKSRETIYGPSTRASAERAASARKEADRLACEAWNQRMLGYKGPAQPSPALSDALNAGYRYLEVRCLGCDTHQTVALDIVRRPKSTPIHELERYMHCTGPGLPIQAEPPGGAADDQDFSQ
jgi:hypothetical protein